MADISVSDVQKLAKLSALKLSEGEVQSLREQLQEIIGFVEQLNEVKTEGVKPTYQVTGLENVWRKDEVIDYKLDREALLANTPYKQDGQIKVKRVLT